MNEGTGKGFCNKRRGRPRVYRSLAENIEFQCFAPICEKNGSETSYIVIHPEEMESMRLVDLLGMEQEDAANTIGVSRKTLWRDLHEARRKVIEALVNGSTIHISGCKDQGSNGCPHKSETEE